MDYRKFKESLIYLAIIFALLVPRLPALDSFSTLDEPYWLSMGANFYYALGQREFQYTVYEYQPAVTTMWIVTAAMLVYFPEYRGLGQGYLEYEKGALDPFMLEHGKDPLILLYDARLIQVLIITVLFLLLFFLLQRIVSKSVAFFSIIFASFDPFFLGQSRLLDHEAMLSLFLVIAVISFLIYLSYGRNLAYLVLSGIMAGLAQLTKSSAIAILAPIGMLLLFHFYNEHNNGFRNAFLSSVKMFSAWLLIVVVAYFVFWPGMWVAPKKMLHEVYGNAFSYAFQGARLKATEDAPALQPSVQADLSGMFDLIGVFLWRTTPLTWLGILLGFVFSFISRLQLACVYRQLSIPYLFTALAFILMFGIAQGRDSPHYILTSYLALNLFAALGWFQLIVWLAVHTSLLRSDAVTVFALSALTLFQAFSTASFFPYYYTYRNPILYSLQQDKNFPQFGYGEGLELAAGYLAKLPDSKNSTALVYYARGSFSYFYPGETTRFKPYFVDANQREELLSSIHAADFLVLYYASQGNLDKYDALFDSLSTVKPVHEVWLNGYKYVVVYKIDDFSPDVLEELAQ